MPCLKSLLAIVVLAFCCQVSAGTTYTYLGDPPGLNHVSHESAHASREEAQDACDAFAAEFGSTCWFGGYPICIGSSQNYCNIGNFLRSGVLPYHGAQFLFPDCPKGSVLDPTTGDCVEPKEKDCENTSNPINPATGYKHKSAVDFQEQSAFPLTLSRGYIFNTKKGKWSFSHVNKLLWRDLYEDDVHYNSTYDFTQVKITRPNGAVIRFSGTQRSSTDTPDYVSTVHGDAYKLEKLFSGSTHTGWRLTMADGMKEEYDAGTDTGDRGFMGSKLLSVKNQTGLSHTVTYPSSLVTRVTNDATGTELDYTYVTTVHGHFVLDKVDVSDVGTFDYTYDSSARLTSVTYPDSSVLTYHYENTTFPEALTGITDENSNRSETYGYNSDGRAIFSTLAGDAERVDISYALTSGGNHVSAATLTNAVGKESVYHFDEDATGSRVLTQVEGEAMGSCLAADSDYTYDSHGYRKTKTDPNGFVTYTDRNSRGLIETIETAETWSAGVDSTRVPQIESQKVVTTWDTSKPLPTGKTYFGYTSSSWVDYRSEALTYDGNNRLDSSSVTDIVNSVTRSWDYTTTYHSGTVVPSTVVVDGPRSDVSDITTYNYNASGQLISVVLPTVGSVTQTTTYDDYNAWGLPETITDSNDIVTTLVYDSLGRLESSTTAGAATGITYWPNGLTKRITSPDGSWLQYSYNSAHQLTGVVNQASESITLTPSLLNGQWTSAVVKNSSSAVVSQQARVFDALGRVWKQLDADDNDKTVFNYDANDNLRAVIALGDSGTTPTYDDVSQATTRSFDGQNRLTSESRCIDSSAPTFPYSCASALATTTYTYDDQGNVHTVTDANGNVTTYTYNGFGELVTQVSPDTGVTTYEYDAAGNLAIKTKGLAMISGVPTSTADTQVIYYTWDALNRLATINYPGTDRDVAYDYDEEAEGFYGIGHLTHVEDASGTTDYLYNALGKVARKTETLGAVEQATNYHYSANGVLEKTIYPSGLEITAASSAAGKATGLSDTTGTAATLLSSITHQPFGGIKGWQTASASEAIDRYFRTFDANGRIASYGVGSASEQAESTLDYDAYGNISAVNSYDSGKSELYEYDGLSRLSEVTANYGRIGYSYDAVGNRTETVYEKQDPATHAWEEFYTEAYDIATGSNRLEGITRKKGTTTLRTRVFDYDERGNIKTDTRQKTGATATVHSLNYGNSDRLDTISAP